MFLKKLSAFFSIAVLLSAFSSLFFWLFMSGQSAFSEKESAAAASVINEEYRSGDVIFSYPEWDIGFTKYLRDGIVDISYGVNSFSREDLDEMLPSRENSFFFFVKEPAKWDEFKRRFALTERSRHAVGDALLVKAYSSRRNSDVLIDFVANIDQAKEVYFENFSGEKRPCVLAHSKWSCGNDSWTYIAPQRALMGDKWQKANWAHPASMTKTHIVFRNSANADKVVLGTAFLESAYRNGGGDAVEVELLADGKPILSYTNHNVKRYYRFEKELPAGTKEIDITFFVRRDGSRHFVFNGYLGKK